MASIQERITSIVVDVLGVDEERVVPEARFREDLVRTKTCRKQIFRNMASVRLDSPQKVAQSILLKTQNDWLDPEKINFEGCQTQICAQI